MFPSTVTSHTVCVVDQSGSMRKHDVGKYGSRSQASATLTITTCDTQVS